MKIKLNQKRKTKKKDASKRECQKQSYRHTLHTGIGKSFFKMNEGNRAHLRIDTGDWRTLWQKRTILNIKAGINMHHISTEKEYFPLSIDIFDFESKYGGRKLYLKR